MIFTLPINGFGVRTQAESLPNPSYDFQSSIQKGSISTLEALVEQGININAPLPNGEMPLHFAVCNNLPDVVKALLALGAKPEIQDFQNLTAIDHSVLMKNNEILALLVSHKIGKDIQDVQHQIVCKHSSSLVQGLYADIYRKLNFDFSELSSLSKAAYKGDVIQNISREAINEFDANGLTPMHYAILANRLQVVTKFIEQGADLKMTTKEGDSLLHFAVLAKSIKTLRMLIQAGADIHHKNVKGQTPLHFAAVNENFNLIRDLIKLGADPYSVDNDGMSCLSFIGFGAYMRDPLALSSTQLLLFATSLLHLTCSIASMSEWAFSAELKTAVSLLAAGSSFASGLSEFVLLMQNLNKNWKKVFAWACYFGSENLSPLNTIFQFWRTYHVACDTFQGLKKCWKNGGYRPITAATHAVVHSTNLACSVSYLYTKFFKMDPIKSFVSSKGVVVKENCKKVNSRELKQKTDIERINYPDLDPGCDEDALRILNLDFTLDQLMNNCKDLSKKGCESLYHTTYKKLSKQFHPDKPHGDEQTQKRLNAAKEVVIALLEKHLTIGAR